MFFHVETIVYSVIVCIVELQYLETITFEQEEYNIIANKPLKLVCNIENSISATIRIRTPDNTLVVSCEPTITSPIVVPGSCSSSTGVYTGSINETANTVTVTTNTLPGDVNGTWLCTHGSSSAGIVFPNPIPCLVSENFDLNPSSLTGNITSDMAEISLSATYRCINVDVSFKWILKAGTNHEFISNLVSTNSSVCSDTGTCTGVNAYTQTISSNSIFQFATGQSLQGVYELSLEVHYANGMFALKSQSIGNFEFRLDTSTDWISTSTTDEQSTTFQSPSTSTLDLQSAKTADSSISSTFSSKISEVTLSVIPISMNSGENMGENHLHLILIIVVSSVCGVIVISVVVVGYRRLSCSNKGTNYDKSVEFENQSGNKNLHKKHTYSTRNDDLDAKIEHVDGKKKNNDKNEQKGGKRLKNKHRLPKTENNFQFYNGRASKNKYAFKLNEPVETRQTPMTYVTERSELDQIATVPYNSEMNVNNIHGQTSYSGRKMLAFPQYNYNFSRTLRNQPDRFHFGGHHFNNRGKHSNYPYAQQRSNVVNANYGYDRQLSSTTHSGYSYDKNWSDITDTIDNIHSFRHG